MELFTENSISGHACLFKGDLKNLIVNSKDIVCQTSYMYDQVIGAIASFKGGVAYYDRPLTRHRIHQSNNYNSLLHRETSILSSREDAKAARREARKKLPRSSFLKRKRKRFSLKIERAQEKIALTEMLLKIEGSPESEISSNAISKFDRCFFNRHLYTRLLQLCIKKETAK